MPRKKKQMDAFEIITRSEKAARKSPPPSHATRGQDKDGRDVDYIRHEPCKGKGCDQCNGLGFTKQLVML